MPTGGSIILADDIFGQIFAGGGLIMLGTLLSTVILGLTVRANYDRFESEFANRNVQSFTTLPTDLPELAEDDEHDEE